MGDTDSSNQTLLSDLIADHVSNSSSESWSRFLEGLRKSQLGVLAQGAPADTVGEYTTVASRPVSVGLTRHADGRPMALAFADPNAFAARFGRPFNAALSGEALLAAVLLNPECDGILVNSALAEVSVAIDRATVEALARPAAKPQRTTQPWWRRWWLGKKD